MLIFESNIIEEIHSHARTEYPKECCGILIGKWLGENRIVHKMIQTRNMIDEKQNAIHFLMNPLDVVRVELLAEEEKLEIVGFYHSHPDYEAIASREDVLHMIEGYSYLIVSVKNGVCVGENSFEKVVQTDTDVRKEEIQIKEK